MKRIILRIDPNEAAQPFVQQAVGDLQTLLEKRGWYVVKPGEDEAEVRAKQVFAVVRSKKPLVCDYYLLRLDDEGKVDAALLLERKTMDEIYNEILTKRWHQQFDKILEVMVQQRIPCIVALIGTFPRSAKFANNEEHVLAVTYGALTALAARYGIPVIPTTTRRAFVHAMASLVRRLAEWEEWREYIPVDKRRGTVADFATTLLATFPNVGVKRAQEIIARYPRESLVTLLQNHDKLVRVLGRKIGTNVYRIATMPFEQAKKLKLAPRRAELLPISEEEKEGEAVPA